MNVLELSEQEIIRRNSLEELRKMGINPYPAAEYVTNAFSTDIREQFKDDEVVYYMSSGASLDVAYSSSICLMMEMQWINSGSFHSAEALARIIDPEYGLIPPSVFIPAAETQGFIIPIGDAVLDLWSKNKMAERHQNTCTQTLRSITPSLPALLRAVKVLKRCADVGMEDLQTEDNIGKLITRTVSSPGESYAYVKCGDGYVWTDIDTLNSETDASQIFTFGNALIKAYTVDDPAVLVGPDYPAPAGPANYIPLYVLGGAILAAVIYLLITNKNR